MTGLVWFSLLAISFGALAYHRASRAVWTVSAALLLVLLICLAHVSGVTKVCVGILFLLIFIPINVLTWRRRYISQRLLTFYRSVMPTMSRTEREALAAGTVTWEGELFCGAPRWKKLLQLAKPQLTAEEKAFIDGPVETLCSMIDDWDITHNLADLPPELWQYIKENGFFGLIIPKQYGGKQFSAYAHSQILTKIYGLSSTVATTVSVPNSLGPAELLLHYGTEQQKSYYLPRLARGEEIPCFALTGPDAGSDAGAMPDTGVVCWGEHDGQKTLGIRLNFNKRYITLAPVATVVGLAFKLLDPEQLLGNKENLGITCALIPRDTPNMSIGRRHFPLNIVFQNGPIHGKDVFIPVEWIIGGVKMAGHGWRMLMECLAAGRAISLPSSSVGGAKALAFATGAYSRIRRQFKVAIGSFEGVEEALTRLAANTYVVDAARSFAAAAIDAGEKPAIASAILKYHATEIARQCANDAMDVHGGKGICMGPNNYLARGYQSVPIAITVEGANILTRNMIIFGQGAMRCHPYIFAELEAAKLPDEKASLVAFDKAIMGHLSYSLSNVVRALVLSLSSGLLVFAPSGKTKRYFQQSTRFSAAFALIADASLIILGGALKRKESISARLGDILSYLYLVSAVLKHHADQGQPEEDLPLVHWACQHYFYLLQEKFADLLQNFPNRFAAFALQLLIFPLGKNFRKPSDKLGHKVAKLLTAPSATRQRLTAGMVTTTSGTGVYARIEDALLKTIAVEPLEKVLKNAVSDKVIGGMTLLEQADAAVAIKLISAAEREQLMQADAARRLIINVDDFAPEDLMRVVLRTKSEDLQVEGHL